MPPQSGKDFSGRHLLDKPQYTRSGWVRKRNHMTTSPAETRFLAALLAPGTSTRLILSAAPQLQGRDLADPADAIIYGAIIDCAAAGQAGPELVLARLREDGHLERDIDKRLTVRLSSLATTVAEPLQSAALAAEIMDRAEVRLMESVATDILERAAALSARDRRDLMNRFWLQYKGITERVDATSGRAGVAVERPALKVVASA